MEVLWHLEKGAKVTTTTILVILFIPAVTALALVVSTQWGVYKTIEWLRRKGWVK